MNEFNIDFIGVGVNKAGTSWLTKMLDAHPMICTSVQKEVHFFHDQVEHTRAVHQNNFPKGLRWYQRFFRHCTPNKIKGEFTPVYFIDPLVPKRIFQMFPKVKLIVCLRSPVDRAASQYYFQRYFNHVETRPISQAIREDPFYVDHGLYYAGICRFLEFFPLSQIHLIWFEDIAEKPESVLADVYTFLGVDPSFRPAHMNRKQNASKMSRSKWLRDLSASIRIGLSGMGLSWVVKFLTRIGVAKIFSLINSRKV
jgi:hypothetical protein